MDDQSLNREIESALNVDPSPEFLAKVRTRIAAEPAPGQRVSLRRLVFEPLFALGVAGFLALIVVPALMRETPVAVLDRVVADVPPAPIVESPRAESLPAPSAPPPRVGRRRAARLDERRVAAGQPGREERNDVVISEDDRRGFQMLLMALAQDRVPVRMQPIGEAEATLVPPPIEVPDLIVEPLLVARLD